jgi:cob(I)alamin adenosyltransferase
MSVTGFHLRLKSIEDCMASPSTNLTIEDLAETAKDVFNSLISTNEEKITGELKTVTDKMRELDNDLTNVKTSLSSIKLTSEDVEETAKNVFNTLNVDSEAKITEELKTSSDKMQSIDNELATVKMYLSSLTADFAKKDDLTTLVEKIEKIEKIVDKINSKQDTIVKRIVVLEKKDDGS